MPLTNSVSLPKGIRFVSIDPNAWLNRSYINEHGGYSRLVGQGVLDCMGYLGVQLLGFTKEQMHPYEHFEFMPMTPGQRRKLVKLKLMKHSRHERRWVHTKLAWGLMTINDGGGMSAAERITLLNKTLAHSEAPFRFQLEQVPDVQPAG